MLPILFQLASLAADSAKAVPLNRQEWLTTEDYPPEAVRNAWHGIVKVELAITNRGNVENCSVVQTSGHDVLDSETCRILIARAKFDPPKDPAGNNVSSIFVATFNWKLPEEADGRNVLVRFLRQGSIVKCIVTVDGQKRTIEQRACDSLLSYLPDLGRSSPPRMFWLLNSTPLEPK